MKKYYSIENAINKVSKKFHLNLKDANEMDEKELEEAERVIMEYVEFVENPEYIQLVPKIKGTNELLLWKWRNGENIYQTSGSDVLKAISKEMYPKNRNLQR